MIKLRYVGVGPYRGVDPETLCVVVARPGQVVVVSEAKARQLVADFPGAWEELEGESRPHRRRRSSRR